VTGTEKKVTIMHSRRQFMGWLLVSAGCLSTAPLRASQSVEDLPLDQQRNIKRLLQQYQRARRSPQRRMKTLEQLLELGPPAAAALLEMIDQELQPQLSQYRERFSRVVSQLAGSSGDVTKEIVYLRQQVLELGQRQDLTKEMIQQQADPAMTRLSELFTVDVDQVFRRVPALARQRTQLETLVEHRALCMAALADPGAQGSAPQDMVASGSAMDAEDQATAQMALATDPNTQAIMNANAKLSIQIDPEEARGIHSLNMMRIMLGLRPLGIDLALCATARDHSHDMRVMNFFSHESPVPGKQHFNDRAQRFKTTASAENIYHGSPKGTAAIMSWFHSPGHHRNMLGRFARVGLGRDQTYWTQVFGN
jgi:uncharacterized protein YkwD